ncbi:uncharacterized protein LOC134657193 [Cydia amplana]|uniref:uncharacterized protein LOC134657193 n=1 Tax=Cydia amplana TaxID=1869771 RepID=UPI002FE654AB
MSSPVVVKQIPLEKEYAKKTGVTPEDVAKLRAWLATQPHLPSDLITDLELVLVYHCCQRSAEVSKQVLDLHFTLKTLFENLFKDLLVNEKMFAALSISAVLPLKARAHDGSAITYCSIIDQDARKYVFIDALRVSLMLLELAQEEQGTWPGLQIVFDMRTFSLQHLAKMDLHSVQQFIYYLQVSTNTLQDTWRGLQIIFDMRTFSLQHLAKMDLHSVQQFIYYLQVSTSTLQGTWPELQIMFDMRTFSLQHLAKMDLHSVQQFMHYLQVSTSTLQGTWPGLQIVFDMRTFSLQHLAKMDLHSVQQFIYYLQVSTSTLQGTWPELQIIFHMRTFSLQHLAKMHLHSVQQFMYYLQEAMLVRVTGIHFMNTPAFMDRVLMLIKPFMKKTLLEVLFIHQTGSGTLEKYIPVEGLPEEAGGEFISVMKASANLQERLKLNEAFFEQRNKRRVVEALRPGRPKTITDIFGGIEGSFKKLDID